LVTITIIKSIICQRPLNVTIYIVIFVLFLFFIHQWNITHQVYGLYFGNNIVINSGNVSSSFTKGQMSSVERGYPYVVWVDKNNTIYFGASHENGTKFSSPIALSSNNTLAFSPQIVATEKGGVYVVWVDKKENGDTNIAFITSNNSGKDFTNRKYLRANDLFSFSPQIVATEKGGVYVVWVDKNNATGDSNIVFRDSNDSGKSFDRSVRLNRNASPNQTSVASYPQIVATEKGGVYVVWVDKNNATGDSNIVFRGSNDSGKSFDSSVRLNRNPNQISLSFSPQIAASENGSIFVTWPENTLQFKEILDGGNIFGRTVSLNNHVVLPLSAQIVSAENGNIYLAWAEKTDGLNNDAVLMFKRISQYYFDRR